MDQSANQSGPTIGLAFRFHTNLYHSYRGDTSDERGFGKDIRIITSILDDLDQLNAEGIPVYGTWDIENYYSLEKILPQFAPQIIERLQKRVRDGFDAVAPMSWNNGIVSVCTPEEFDYVVGRTISNGEGSGLADLFAAWEPVLRPQECMYTPSFLTRYPASGISAISLYYSSHPFNGFSNFVDPLDFVQRYNPLRLTSRDLPGEMLLLPAYNHGDIADNWLSHRHWVRSMRRRQRALSEPQDLLLLVDMDADDDFWCGLDIPVLTRLFPSFDGLYRLVKSVADLPWIRFTTPGAYVNAHPPVGEVRIDQDTADGSFDGLASWAEKWSNTQLWSVVAEARAIRRRAKAIAPDDPSVRDELERALHAITLTMSTTHFGLASPVMHPHRLETGFEWANRARDHAARALSLAKDGRVGTEVDAARGGPQRLDGPGTMDPGTDDSGTEDGVRLSRIRILAGADRGSAQGSGLTVTEDGISNDSIGIRRNQRGGVDLYWEGRRINRPGHPVCSVTYAGQTRRGQAQSVVSGLSDAGAATLELSGSIRINRDAAVVWEHAYALVPGLPYLAVTIQVVYPETEHRGYSRWRAEWVGDSWDARWQEVMPWEFAPDLGRDLTQPLTIWKHNFLGDITRFDLDYGRRSGNPRLASINNQITNGWVAVAAGGRALLLAQSERLDNSFAFCPMRYHSVGRSHSLWLNPFGTYHGKQYRYQSAATGIGRLLSLRMAHHLESYAPSFNGRTTRFRLLVAPYAGDRPDELLCRDAMAFATARDTDM